MQIRPLCGYYTRVNTPLRVKSIAGNAVLLYLPFQINSLTYQVTNMHGYCNKHCENKWREKTDYTVVGIYI